MIHLTLYKNTADKIRLKKGTYLTNNMDFIGEFRDSVNIETPVISLSIEGLFNYNYAYIKELNRYYFIDTFDIECNNLVTVYMTEDYLMSHKDSIQDTYVQLDRWEYAYSDGIDQNKLLIDNYLPRLNKVNYSYISANTSSSDEDITNLKNPTATNTDNYYFRLLTPSQGFDISDKDYIDKTVPSINTWGCHSYILSKKQIDFLFFYMYTDASFLPNLFKICSDPSTTIKSIMIFPFDIPANYSINKYFLSEYLTIGNKQLDLYNNTYTEGSLGYLYFPKKKVINILKYTAMRVRGGSITLTFDFGVSNREPIYDWAKREPYSNCKLFIPFVGFVNIDLSIYIDKTIYLDYTVDIQTGLATAYLNTAFDSNLESYDYQRTAFASYKCQMGAEVPFSNAEFSKTVTNLGTNLFNTALKLAASGSVAHEELLIANHSAKTKKQKTDAKLLYYENRAMSINGVSNVLHNLNSNHANSCMSAEPSSSWNSIVGYLYMFAICTYTKFYEPTNYKKYVGYPSMDTDFIKNFTGYLKVSGTYAEQYLTKGGFSNATENERDIIISMLKDGIIV